MPEDGSTGKPPSPDMVGLRPIDRSKLFLALMAGAALTGAFPRTGLFFLAGAAYIPLLLSLRDVSTWSGFRLGLVTGLAHALSLLYWIAPTITTYGHIPMAVAVGILMLLATYIALYTAALAALAVYAGQKPATIPILLPVLLAGLEYLRGHLLTGFPWGFLGHSQYAFRPFIQTAEITGVYGVSFVLMLINAALFLLVLWKSGKAWQGSPVDRRTAVGWGVAALGVVMAAVFYGQIRMGQIQKLASAAPPFTCGRRPGQHPPDRQMGPGLSDFDH